ncbi:MAG: hypothetical protein WCI72_04435 [archaeon]
MVEQKITAMMIIEVAGRPPEYLEEQLRVHLDKLNQIKDVKLISLKIAEPRLIEEEKDLYTCFGEVEVETIGFSTLIDLVFDFMPSSIEIISPNDIEFNCQEATMFANDMAGRLHKYDELAKIARMQIQQLSQQLQQSRPAAIQAPANPIQPVKISMNTPEKEVKSNKQKPSKKSKASKKKK